MRVEFLRLISIFLVLFTIIPFSSAEASPVMATGTVVISGTTYTVVEVLQPPPAYNYSPVAQPLSIPSEVTSNDFQYGIFMLDANGMFGVQFNLTEFEGEGNPSGFSIWDFFTDNVGYFYQTTLTYWGPGEYSGGYGTTNPKNPYGLVGTYPISQPNQFNYHAVVESYVLMGVFIYEGQVYTSYIFSNGSSYIRPFPGGPDGGSYIRGAGGIVMEGGDTGTYDSGVAIAEDPCYIWKITTSGNTIYLYLWYSDDMAFYKTQHASSPPCELIVHNSTIPYAYVFTFNQSAPTSTYFTSGFAPVPSAIPKVPAYALFALTSSTSSITSGESVQLTAFLRYYNGTPIAGQPVSFYANGTSIGTTSTDPNGMAVISFKPSGTGTYVVEAQVQGEPGIPPRSIAISVKGSSSAWFLFVALVVIVAIGALAYFSYRSRRSYKPRAVEAPLSSCGGRRAAL